MVRRSLARIFRAAALCLVPPLSYVVNTASAQTGIAAPVITDHARNHAESRGRLTLAEGSSLVEIVPQTAHGEGLVLRVTLDLNNQPRRVEEALHGTYIHMQDFEWNGLHVLDMDGDGLDEIVTITAASASLGAALAVWEIQDGELVKLTPKRAGGSQFTLEKAPDGRYRVKCYGRWTNEETSTLEVWEWDGQKFQGHPVEGPAKQPRNPRRTQ